MNQIRKLIISEWFKFFFAALLVLLLILSVANLISGFLRSNVTPQEVLFNHLLELPANLKLIVPVSCLVASLFSINKLKNRNELTAIFAGGYSRKRFIRDIVSAAATVALVQLLISSYIEPFAKANRHMLIKDGEAKFRNLKSKGLRASTIGSGKIWYKAENYFFSFSAFDRYSDTMSGVTAYFFDREHKLSQLITGEKVKFIKDKWIIDNGNALFNLNNDLFPKENDLTNAILPIKETPDDFKQIEADITTLNIIKLGMYIRKLSAGGININEYLVMFLEKFSTPIICIIFSMVASISMFNPNRRNSSFGKSLGLIFVFTLLYWLVNSYFIEMGKSSKINPYLAVFSVPLLFSLFLTGFFFLHKRLR